MFLQDRAQFFQALAVSPRQRVTDLVEASIDTLECHILVGRRVIGLEKPINAGAQHRGILAHKPELVARLADHHLLVKAQLGQNFRPALGNGFFHDRQVKNPGLHHLQDVFHRQAGVNPFDFHGGALVQSQFLIDLTDGIRRRTARGQRQRAT